MRYMETPTRRDKSQGQSSNNRLHTPSLYTLHYTSSASSSGYSYSHIQSVILGIKRLVDLSTGGYGIDSHGGLGSSPTRYRIII
jgi:hypothetical protein